MPPSRRSALTWPHRIHRPEPLDAYRRFVDERPARHDFEILNKDLEAGFWRYYVTDTLQSFYPSGSEKEKQAFDTPWWLSNEAPGYAGVTAVLAAE